MAKLSTDKKATIPYIKACNAFLALRALILSPKVLYLLHQLSFYGAFV